MNTQKKAKTKKKAPASTSIGLAKLRNVRISPQKVRLVADLIRGKGLEDALNALRFLPKKGARMAEKLIQSAMNNAREQKGADVDRLFIKEAYVDRAPIIKRYMARAQGRTNQIKKRMAHITVVLGER